MIKLFLVSGKTAVFTVKDRETLEELRQDCQSRMDAAKFQDDPDVDVDDVAPRRSSMRQSQRDNNNNDGKMKDSSRKSTTTTTRVVFEDEPIKERQSTANPRSPRCCGVATWCCLFWFLIVLLLLGLAAFLLYWFIFRDTDAANDVLVAVGAKPGAADESRPPDVGKEARYGIRAVNHEWNQEELVFKYQVSDYILDESIRPILYDAVECRDGSNDITKNDYVFMSLVKPQDTGANLNNDGRGSRQFDIRVILNKGTIADAPFFTPIGLEAAQLRFCVGFSVNYNKVNYWRTDEEVRIMMHYLCNGGESSWLLFVVCCLLTSSLHCFGAFWFPRSMPWKWPCRWILICPTFEGLKMWPSGRLSDRCTTGGTCCVGPHPLSRKTRQCHTSWWHPQSNNKHQKECEMDSFIHERISVLTWLWRKCEGT
jgi:hypothetical protein